MKALPQTTQRRLKKLPQIPNVWEGDRRSLSSIGATTELSTAEPGECIIWVDGLEGYVRAMDIIPPMMGIEAIVRTLLRAMESPDGPAQAARPQKIVVRDREIQFFLRGALQSLEIAVEYVPDLPLIDELFRRFEAVSRRPVAHLSPQYERLLTQVASQLWEESPWELIADHDILAIEINRWDVETIYACVMGMLGQEYGIVLYRSLESLKQFRALALTEESPKELEKAFLSQDCWFLNFEESADDDLEIEFDLDSSETSDIRPLFGSIHPYEGMRPLRDEEEARVIYVALKALERFFQSSQLQLVQEMSDLSKSFRLSLPANSEKKMVSITVSMMPELTQELLAMVESEDADDAQIDIPIQDDLIPEGAVLTIGMIPWHLVATLHEHPKTLVESCHDSSWYASSQGDGLPIVLIQTSRPKAKVLIETIQAAGGLKAICFNPGEDPYSQSTYDLGLLQTGNGNFYLFGEFINEAPEHVKARQAWDRRCQKTGSRCGLIVAMGATGTSRGNPQLRDMLALFETQFCSAEELGLGVLELNYTSDPEI